MTKINYEVQSSLLDLLLRRAHEDQISACQHKNMSRVEKKLLLGTINVCYISNITREEQVESKSNHWFRFHRMTYSLRTILKICVPKKVRYCRTVCASLPPAFNYLQSIFFIDVLRPYGLLGTKVDNGEEVKC